MGRKDRHRRKLSDTLAIRILDLEAEMDANRSIELVHQLLELYTRAVEYYSSEADNKYLHYHKRIQCLLAQAEDQKIFGKPSDDKDIKRKKSGYCKEVEQTLSQFLSDSLTSCNQAKRDLCKQDSLQTRISQRKSQKMSNSNSAPCLNKKI